MREPAFEIRPIGDKGEPVGSIIRIYADGSVEGIDGGFIVFNRIPLLVERGKHEERLLRASQVPAGIPNIGKPSIVSNGEAGHAGGAAEAEANIDAKRKARNEAVDLIEKFCDGMDRLLKQYVDPLFKRQ